MSATRQHATILLGLRYCQDRKLPILARVDALYIIHSSTVNEKWLKA